MKPSRQKVEQCEGKWNKGVFLFTVCSMVFDEVPVLPEILHVGYADGWVGDAIVNDSIHCHCYRVP